MDEGKVAQEGVAVPFPEKYTFRGFVFIIGSCIGWYVVCGDCINQCKTVLRNYSITSKKPTPVVLRSRLDSSES